MSAIVERLANGLTLALEPMPGAASVAIGLYVGVGARSEPDRLGGLAHLVEHMVFKGAGHRDARAIAEAIEDVGGSLNAWTARDQTAFHARVLPADTSLALELIADLVRRPALDEDELEREKLVILSELGEAIDTPDDLIHDHLFEAAFGACALARPVLGREPTIRAATRADCADWLARQYAPSRLVIAATGAIDPSAIRRDAERLFGDLADRPAPPIAPASWAGGRRIEARRTEQAQLALAWPGLSAADPAGPALGLFAHAVGGGMSSRLFQQLREERGLAYSIFGWTQGFADTGLFAINMATDKARAAEALALARDVVADAAETLTQAELDRARAQLEAGLTMAMETVPGRCDALARSIEVFGRAIPLDEMIAQYRAVDVEACRGVGRAMLAGPTALATIGAGSGARLAA